MAIKNIRKSIEGIYARIDPANPGNRSKKARAKSDNKYAHIMKVDPDRFSQQMSTSINNAIRRAGPNEIKGGSSKIATKADVRNATNYVIKKHKNLQGFRHSSVTTKIKGGVLWLHRKSSKSSASPEWIRKLNAVFKEAVFNKWKKDFKANPDNPPLGIDNIDTDDVKTGKEVGFSHQKKSNIANTVLVDFLEDENVSGTAFGTMTTESVAERIFALLKINWKQTQDPITGKMEWVVMGELAGRNPPHESGVDLGPTWEQNIIDRFDEVLAGTAGEDFKDPNFVASKPFTQQVLDSQVNNMLDYYKKVSNARIIGKPKKAKKTRRSGKVENKARAPKNKTTKIASSAAVPSMRRERGSGRQASTHGAAQLAQLKAYINSRLPAEVRRNMGRPALQNQTSRFSNSVQLMSLVEGPRTLIAKYTYLLSPYQTFENTGKRRWPLAYNPKPLIAKSIRNLAQGRIERKLTVRRV